MDPTLILGLIQLGSSLIGSWLSGREAQRQETFMENALNRQAQTAMDAVNAAARLANRDWSSVLAPAYSATLGQGLSQFRAAAGAAGLTGSGLDAAGQLAAATQSAAALNRDLAGIQSQAQGNLLSTLSTLSQVYGQQAGLRASLAEKNLEGIGIDLSWLPLLLQNRNFQMPTWGMMSPGTGSPSTPTPLNQVPSNRMGA
jgi:hypothetical protein